MKTSANESTGHSTSTETQPNPTAELLDVIAIAILLSCSKRHVIRLADSGRMPRPVKLGSLVRWRRAELMAWLQGGCQPVRATKGHDR